MRRSAVVFEQVVVVFHYTHSHKHINLLLLYKAMYHCFTTKTLICI